MGYLNFISHSFGGHCRHSLPGGLPFGTGGQTGAATINTAKTAPRSTGGMVMEFDTGGHASGASIALRTSRTRTDTPPTPHTNSVAFLEFDVYRDAGTRAGDTWLCTTVGAGADDSFKKKLGLRWNAASGDIECWNAELLVNTIPISSNVWTHIRVYGRDAWNGALEYHAYKNTSKVFGFRVQDNGWGEVRDMAKNWGDAQIVGNTFKFWVANVCGGRTDRTDPLGRTTTKKWDLATATPTFNESVKVPTGTAAANVDERPPSDIGTTDVDYFSIKDASSLRRQSIHTADSLLFEFAPFKDDLQKCIQYLWTRTASGAFDIMFTEAYTYDGTTRRTNTLSTFVGGPTSWAEHFGASSIITGDEIAPDGTLWNTKANAYLNGCQFGIDILAASTNNSTVYVGCMVIEAVVVLNIDKIAFAPLSDVPIDDYMITT